MGEDKDDHSVTVKVGPMVVITVTTSCAWLGAAVIGLGCLTAIALAVLQARAGN